MPAARAEQEWRRQGVLFFFSSHAAGIAHAQQLGRSQSGSQRFRQGFHQPATCESCRHRKCLLGLRIGLRITSRLKRAYSRTLRCVYRQVEGHRDCFHCSVLPRLYRASRTERHGDKKANGGGGITKARIFRQCGASASSARTKRAIREYASLSRNGRSGWRHIAVALSSLLGFQTTKAVEGSERERDAPVQWRGRSTGSLKSEVCRRL
jgi:hypothetical protein